MFVKSLLWFMLVEIAGYTTELVGAAIFLSLEVKKQASAEKTSEGRCSGR